MAKLHAKLFLAALVASQTAHSFESPLADFPPANDPSTRFLALDGKALTRKEFEERLATGEVGFDVSQDEHGTTLRMVSVPKALAAAVNPNLPAEGMGERSIATASLRDSSGLAVDLTPRGKVTFLALWFADCPPCVKEVPTLNALRRTFSKAPVDMIAATYESVDIAVDFQSKYKLELPLAFAPLEHLQKEFGIGETLPFPTLLVYGHDGKLLKTFRGEPSSATLESAIFEALGRKSVASTR